MSMPQRHHQATTLTGTIYRYYVAPIPAYDTFLAYLNRMGADGWCLVSRTDSELIFAKLHTIDGYHDVWQEDNATDRS